MLYLPTHSVLSLFSSKPLSQISCKIHLYEPCVFSHFSLKWHTEFCDFLHSSISIQLEKFRSRSDCPILQKKFKKQTLAYTSATLVYFVAFKAYDLLALAIIVVEQISVVALLGLAFVGACQIVTNKAFRAVVQVQGALVNILSIRKRNE